MKRCAAPPLVPSVPPFENSDQATVQVFQAAVQVFHLHRQAVQRRLTGAGAHHGELISLRLLAQNDGMSQCDLAETLHLSRPRITSILQGLEKSGAVTRTPDADDHRITRVFLTPEGRRRELGNRAAFDEYVSSTFGALNKADRKELARLLDEVSGHIAAFLCPDVEHRKGREAS
jgi:DNA-binding MarR family transcriptional regulator